MKNGLVEFLITILGCFAFGIGAVTIIQYLSGYPRASAWFGVVPMASPSAVGFVLVGAAIIMLAYRKKP